MTPAPQRPYVPIDESTLPYDPGKAQDDGAVAYVPGIEVPRGGQQRKLITDRVE